MLLNPLLLTILATDTIGAMLALTAGLKAFQIAVHWHPAEFDRKQLSLEMHADALNLLGQWVLGLLVFSTLLLVVGITNMLPHVVPGAMCGTGVMQAMGGSGGRALLLRLFSLAILFVWLAVCRINAVKPDGPLTQTGARLLLAALPIYFPALYETLAALLHVNIEQPVSCCAIVYDQFRSLQEARSAAGLSDRLWLFGFLVGTGLLMFTAMLTMRINKPANGPTPILLVVISAFWVPVAAVTLVHHFSAYHYGVLQHHCPWCLFLSQYRMVGYPLFGALCVVALEAMVILWLPQLSRPAAALGMVVDQRIRKAGLRILASTLVFLLLSALPALYWRLKYGVWLG
jgi:hypothetical protein